MECPPIKVHSLPDATKLKTGKRKLETAITALAVNVAKSLCVPETALESVEMQGEQNEVLEKAAAFDQMMIATQQKVHFATSYRERNSNSDTLPNKLDNKKSTEFFSASEYAIRAARKLAREKGILSLPDRRHGKEIQDDILEQVHEFYQDDDFPRIMPGKKITSALDETSMPKSALFSAILKSYTLLLRRSIQMQRLPFPSFVLCDLNGVFWLEHQEHILFAYVQNTRI